MYVILLLLLLLEVYILAMLVVTSNIEKATHHAAHSRSCFKQQRVYLGVLRPFTARDSADSIYLNLKQARTELRRHVK